MFHVIKIGCAIAWIYFLGYLTLNHASSFSKNALVISHFGSFCVSFTIICAISKFKKSLIDYTLVWILTLRCIETFILLHLVQNKAAGFELIDLKELSDAIPMIAIPTFVLTCCNFKFDILFTAPMTLLCIFLVNRQALSEENDNLSCFLEPQDYARKSSMSSFFILLYMLFVGYLLRKTTLERFCEQEKTVKQQE